MTCAYNGNNVYLVCVQVGVTNVSSLHFVSGFVCYCKDILPHSGKAQYHTPVNGMVVLVYIPNTWRVYRFTSKPVSSVLHASSTQQLLDIRSECNNLPRILILRVMNFNLGIEPVRSCVLCITGYSPVYCKYLPLNNSRCNVCPPNKQSQPYFVYSYVFCNVYHVHTCTPFRKTRQYDILKTKHVHNTYAYNACAFNLDMI
jgi:hypothetical protein